MEKDFKFKDIQLKKFDKSKLTEIKKKSAFEKIKVIFPFFIEKKTNEAKLVGRVHAELQESAQSILTKLKDLKENIKNELDEGLLNSFEAVINPLIREFTQIEKKIEIQSGDLKQTTSVLKSYADWISKAKAWVSLSSKPDKRKIIAAVIERSLGISDELIDRDLKMLNDYKLHEVYNLGLDFEEIKAALSRLDIELQPHIDGLLKLKHKKPMDMELCHLSEWKARLDEDRAHYYHAGLYCIDFIIKEIAPHNFHDMDEEPLKEIYKKVNSLEEELPIFLGHLVDLNDLVKRQLLESQLAYLEEEVHKVNQDLRLTPELVERVNYIIEELENAHQVLYRN